LNGGWLPRAEDFYRDARAKRAYRQRMRYVLARWGYSPHIMAWIMMGEMEWTDGYMNAAYRPYAQHWLREMSRYVRSQDPWRHPVSVHYSNVGHGVAETRYQEVDIVCNNAYTPLPQLSASNAVEAIDHYYNRWTAQFGKPVLLSEWGGHWMGNRCATLEVALHTGIWTALTTGLAGATGFWWWNFVDAHGQYKQFKPLAEFIKGEDFRGKGLRQFPSKSEGAAALRGLNGLRVRGMRNRSYGVFWVYDPAILVGRDPGYARSIQGAALTIPGMNAGRYVAEFWDTYKGGRIARTEVKSRSGTLSIRLPRVRRDMALKVRGAAVR